MWKPSRRQRKNLERALSGWQANLHTAASYLQGRGIEPATAERFRLGVVASPDPPFDQRHTGRLAIPYFDRAGIVGFNFRCLKDHNCKTVECPKYLQMEGQEVGFFNILALWDSTERVAHVTEGEIDAVVLTQVVGGEPVGGLPGIDKWRPHFPRLLAGFERVVLWADPDKAGDKMRARFKQHVPNVDVVALPAPLDVSAMYVAKGPDAVRALYTEDNEEET